MLSNSTRGGSFSKFYDGLSDELLALRSDWSTRRAKVLNDSALLEKVAIPDLFVAIGVESFGPVQSITNPGNLIKIAEMLGIGHAAKQLSGGGELSSPAVRQEVKERLASGERMEVGVGYYHFIYLVAITDDGVIVHDPAGANLKYPPMFLHSGTVSDASWAWSPRLKDAGHQETMRRRLSRNQEALSVAEKVIAANGEGAEAKAARHELNAVSGMVEMGADNFYSFDECAQ
jgi:hypothetical protein